MLGFLSGSSKADEKKHPRLDTRPQAASALLENGRRHACTVEALSGSGADLSFAKTPSLLPPKFKLLIPERGLNCWARVAWRRGNRVGVHF